MRQHGQLEIMGGALSFQMEHNDAVSLGNWVFQAIISPFSVGKANATGQLQHCF